MKLIGSVRKQDDRIEASALPVIKRRLSPLRGASILLRAGLLLR
jgi:hypothetical protein